jgi:hypothetical protein
VTRRADQEWERVLALVQDHTAKHPLALPQRWIGKESDRLGRLLRMELDGAKTDRAVVAERWLDAELLQRQAILPEPNKSRPAPSLSHQVPNEHAESAGTRKRRNPEEASALEPIIERYPPQIGR